MIIRVFTFGVVLAACTTHHENSQSFSEQISEKKAQVKTALVKCNEKKKIIKDPSPKAAKSLSRFQEAFAPEPCNGCHTNTRSLGALGHLAFSGTELEFAKGLALRHHKLEELIDLCLQPSEDVEKLRNLITSRHRIKSEQNRDRFFKFIGDKKRDHDIVASFLQGAFEDRMREGDFLFDRAYDWLSAGAELPPDAYNDMLAEFIVFNGYAEKIKVVDN